MQKETAFFIEKLKEVINSKLPFVVYRKPNEKLVSIVVQTSNKLFYLDSFQQKGFVFAPFNKNERKILFPASNCEKFSATIQDMAELGNVNGNSIFEEPPNLIALKQQHISLVEKAVQSIGDKKAEKIVVSRREDIQLNEFNVLNSYIKILNNYPNAMVYCWFHPTIGCWMGASPERLINVAQNKFKTMALAGTQPYQGTENVIWKEKEKQEQQFVTDYILETIKSSVTNIKVSNPYSIKAGNLLHIRTDISGDLESDNSLEKLIDSLHPTPAICGLPKDIATDFILQNEGYNRAYYAGYLGELYVENATNLFVNLRCMQIKDCISIYIGGGITKDSIPEKEWDETVVKSAVMKKVL